MELSTGLTLLYHHLKGYAALHKSLDFSKDIWATLSTRLEEVRNEQRLALIYQHLDFQVLGENNPLIDSLSPQALKAGVVLPASLFLAYQAEPLFQSIILPGDKEGVFGALPMSRHFVQLSYIRQQDLKNRATLLQQEQESAKRKLDKHIFERSRLSTGYLTADILQNNRQVVVSGNPGAGKSTYARWLCHQWSSGQLEVRKIPIYIQLRDLSFEQGGNALIAYIQENYLPQTPLKAVRELIRILNQEFVFILDGFDELSRRKQQKLAEGLKKLTQPSGNASYVLLSRPYGLLHSPFRPEIALQIDGFNLSSIENYIRIFLDNHPLSGKSRQELLQLIQDNPILAEYAHNPLMLSYMVLVYLTRENAQRLLAGIDSVYALQEEVYQWMLDYALEHPQGLAVEAGNLKAAMALATELELSQQFVYRSSQAADPFKAAAVHMSRLGLGSLQQEGLGERWHFSFHTATFQEFLSARHLAGDITPEAFIYLLQDKFFWNYCKMLLGALSKQKKGRVIHEILNALEQRYQRHKSLFLRYVRFSLLSETSPIILNRHLELEHLEELMEHYQQSYFDPYWRPIVQEAFIRIYNKLDHAFRLNTKQMIVQKMKSLQNPKHQIRGGATLAYTLFDIGTLTDIADFGPFVEAVLETIKHFFDRIDELEARMKALEDSEEIDYYAAVSSLDQKILEYNNTVFIVFQILKSSSPKQLSKYTAELIGLKPRCPVDVQMDLAEILAKLQDKDALLKELEIAVKKVEGFPDPAKAYFSLSEMTDDSLANIGHSKGAADGQEAVSEALQDEEQQEYEYFPPELLGLACTIYKVGHACSPANQDISQKLRQAAQLFIRKLLNPDFAHLFSNEVKETGELATLGLANAGSQELLEDIFQLMRRLESDVLVNIEDDQHFQAFIQQKMNANANAFNRDSLYQMTTALQYSENGRFGFARYRKGLAELLFQWIYVHHGFFAEADIFMALNEDEEIRAEPVQKIIAVPYFAYDKKFFIDQILEKGGSYPFLQQYAIPFLFEMEFPFYQEDYWNVLYGLSSEDSLPLELLELLTNEGIYWYTSNLQHLDKILRRIIGHLDQRKPGASGDEFSTYAHHFLIIISNTLRLLKQSQDTPLQDDIVRSTGKLLLLPEIRNIYQEQGYLETYEANDMLGYILQYYFTLDSQYIEELPYEIFKAEFPREHRSLLTTLLELFSRPDGSIDHKGLRLLNPALGDSFYQDIQQYLRDYKVLFFRFRKGRFLELIEAAA